MRDRGGLAFIVQSPVASSADLAVHIREFLAGQADAVAALPADEFERFRQGLIARLTERDRNLAERGARLWNDLDLGYTTFDSRARIAAEVERFTQPEIVDYLRTLVNDFDARSLVIYAPGKFTGVPETGMEITDVGAFKKRQAAAAG
jgi:secreted Zn-dependent insulinase-like peptidase